MDVIRSKDNRFVCLGEYLLLLLMGLVFSVGYLKITSHWWYEDDPGIFYYASTVTNPFAIFLDPSVLQNFTTGKALVPMQLLSVWVDVSWFGFQPLGAYLHSLVAFLLALSLIYTVLVAWTGQRAISFAGCLLWLLLPSTISIHEFNAVQMLTAHSTIWRCQDGEYLPDDALYQKLLQDNNLSP